MEIGSSCIISCAVFDVDGRAEMANIKHQTDFPRSRGKVCLAPRKVKQPDFASAPRKVCLVLKDHLLTDFLTCLHNVINRVKKSD